MDKVKAWGSLIVTVLIFAALFWVLFHVLDNLGTTPKKDAKGNIVMDVYQRSKDILTVVLPLATAAVGYWFGADGKDKAEKQATLAQEERSKADAQKAAVLGVGAPNLLEQARLAHPEAFQ